MRDGPPNRRPQSSLPQLHPGHPMTHGHVFGHADLLEDGEFKGRVSLGSARSPDEVCKRLRFLAKSKIDLMAVIHSAASECGRHAKANNSAALPQDRPTSRPRA